MSRLTKNNNQGTGSWTQFGDAYIPAHNIKHKQCVNKLGKLEDLEDELGCPLEIITSKTAMVVTNDSILELNIMAIGFNDGIIYFGSSWSLITRKLKDYKKTWWLKEDLNE